MKRFIRLAIAFGLMLSMSSCAGASERIRYKMVVTVETPEGVKTGYAIREASRYTERSILPDQGGTFYNITKGEAVVVDLEQRGVLFVLLGGEWEAKIIFKALATSTKVGMQDLEPLMKKWGTPRFVYFKDINDPKTVSGANYRDLERDFGAGVTLKQITAELVKEPVNFGVVNKFLPWLSERSKLPGSIGSAPETSFQDPTGLWIKTFEFKTGN